MKRLFLFTMMCLLGLFGSLNAQTNVELNVGLDAQYTGTNKQVPTYTYYNYSFSQQIYTAEELQEMAGNITSLAFRQAQTGAYTRKLSVYLQNVEKSSFTSTGDWIPVSEADLVFTGDVVFPNQAGAWIDLQFQTPFEYTGGNLLVCVADNTGSYTNNPCYFDVYQTSTYQTIYAYRDGSAYNIASPGYANSMIIQKNIVKLNVAIEGEFKSIVVKPNTVELGARPNNAWMRPFDLQIKSRGNDFTVNAIEPTNTYFQVSGFDAPTTVSSTNPMNLTVVNGVAEGEMTGQLVIAYNDSRKVELIDMTAFAYTPVAGDVWETAEAITSYPFSVTPDLATTYDNYLLPGSETDGADVVYVLNFNSDVLLTAAVTGENGKVAIYAEDFNGAEGPMADNNYKGIQVGNANRASQISAMAIPAGKYYLAASSTGEFTLDVNAEAIPAPEKAYNPYPYDKSTGYSYPTLDWDFGANTVEYQLLFGTEYPPQNVYIDWTNNLEVNHYMGNLYHNKIYFWQVNARNSSGTTYGDIWAFTTSFNYPENIKATATQLYAGESTTITWDAVQDRSYRGYNVYVNNQKVNKNLVTTTTYTLDNLAYNNAGHYVTVTAVYDEGESSYGDGVVVYVTGMTTVAGNFYEQDGTTPVLGGSVQFVGIDEFGKECAYTFAADETGAYTGEVLVGEYRAIASCEGYQNKEVEVETYYDNTAVVNFNMTEAYNPVKYVVATEVENAVEVVWGMQRYSNGTEDFESGDFSVNAWNNAVSAYPFAITTEAYEGEYAIKSTCENVDDGISAIEITVDVPFDGVVGFYHKISCEETYDYANFLIDGQIMVVFSGEKDWTYKEVAVTEGTHTYRWEYVKDYMWQSGDDAYYIDNISFYKEPTPFEGGWLMYDDGTYATSIGTGSASPMYWGVSFPSTGSYAGFSLTKVAVFDAAPDYAGSYTANIYAGGVSSPGTLVASKTVNLTGTGDFAEITLDAPVAIDATQPLWIVMYTADLTYPAAGCAYVGESNSDWLSLDGATWEHAADYGLPYSWMVRGYLENAKGERAILSKESNRAKFEGGSSAGMTLMADANAQPRYVGVPSVETAEASRAFASYNLYKKNVIEDEVVKLIEKTTDTAFVDYTWAAQAAGSYQWGVSANYEGNRGAEVIFSEGFEGGVLPAGWTTTATCAYEYYIYESSYWMIDTQESTGYTNPGTCYPYEGNYAAFSDGGAYYYSPEYYIITPAITMQNAPTLNFYYRNPNWGMYYPAVMKVKVSETATGPWTEIWTTGDVQATEWTEAVVDMKDYSGATVYIAFVHEDHYGHYAALDNISVSCVAPESEILWSKPIDKDMYTTVAVAAQTDNGDAVSGTTVSFINMVEEGVEYTVALGEEGTYTWDSFRKGVYELTVAKAGFASSVEAQVVEIWEASQFNAFLTEILAAVEGLYVSPTGWAMWEGAAIGAGAEFAYGFDTDMEGWTTIDNNGDGHVWYHSSESDLYHAVLPGDAHTGAGCIFSESYCNALGALFPDDYVVSPAKVAIGATSVLKFYACTKDDGYPSEHFGVAVSTAGNTSASDFTTIAEWTMTGKGEAKTTRGRGEQGTWYQYSVDLSEYAGQEIWVALRHFNTTDMFILMVDDMELVNEGKADNRALVNYQIMLDGVLEAELTVPYYQHENLVDSVEYTTTVIATYSMGESDEMSYTWTKLPTELFAGVRDLVASYEEEEIALSWTLPSPAPAPGDEVVSSFFTDFETGYTGWPMIDADGDGFNWVYSTDYEDVNAFSGTNCMYSESYYNGQGAGGLEPDNYLIIPAKIAAQQGTTLSFMARAQDENWPEEYFGVAVSTTGKELAEDFTTIAEWLVAEDDKNENVKRGTRGTPWTKYTVDLSAYAGQEIYVAIRHFNCYNEFRLNIDDVKVSVEAKDSKEGTWAYYDNGTFDDGIGGPASFSWGIKLRGADIASLGTLTKVAAYDRLATAGTFDICLGGDNAPGASVLNQTYTWSGSNDFVEITLNEAIDPAGQNVWIILNTADGANFPAAECINTGDADGRWITLDGTTWEDVTAYGLDATWMIRGYFEEVEQPEVEEYAIAEILGVMIYRNGELITKKPVAGTEYVDAKGQLGDEYCVRVVYGGAIDTTYYAMSEFDCAEAEYIINCEAPKKLFGQYKYNANGTFGAELIWPYSSATTEWLYYDDGVNVDGIGGPASFMWGIMFPSSVLGGYDGQFLTKVALYDRAQSSGDIKIYYGGSSAPGTLVHTQAYAATGANAFVEYDLTSALPVDATQNIWVVFTTSQGTNYPASVCADCGDPNSRWISLDGSTWEDITAYGLSDTWMIRAMVSTEAKGAAVSELKAIEECEFTAGEGKFVAEGVARGDAFDHYNIYRGTNANNFEKVGESTVGTYFDEVAAGTYYYQVTAVYSANGEECESAPATAYGNESQDYVVVEVTAIDENGVNGMMVYPNPTKGALNIMAEGIMNVTITNALGQVMYDSSVATDNVVVDMAQYEAGVYMVRITTEAGVAVERITVVK